MEAHIDSLDLARELRDVARVGLKHTRVGDQRSLLAKCPLLCGLPAPRRADTARPTPKFEYLVQAIVDAIDQIETRGLALDAEVLRILFGLTSVARVTSWSARQELAARKFNVVRDHFRSNRQAPLLLEVAETLLESLEEAELSEEDGGLIAAPMQEPLMHRAVRDIATNTLDEALLLELSTATIGPILEALQQSCTPTRLLVSHPDQSHAVWQQQQVRLTLAARVRQTFSVFPQLETRIYRVPPSLRGRLLGEHVHLGWYTYRDDARYPEEDPNSWSIWGHDNAIVQATRASPSGDVLETWFRREFERLWKHRSTAHGDEVTRIIEDGA